MHKSVLKKKRKQNLVLTEMYSHMYSCIDEWTINTNAIKRWSEYSEILYVTMIPLYFSSVFYSLGLHSQNIRYKNIDLYYAKANYLIHSIIQLFSGSVPQRALSHLQLFQIRFRMIILMCIQSEIHRASDSIHNIPCFLSSSW